MTIEEIRDLLGAVADDDEMDALESMLAKLQKLDPNSEPEPEPQPEREYQVRAKVDACATYTAKVQATSPADALAKARNLSFDVWEKDDTEEFDDTGYDVFVEDSDGHGGWLSWENLK